MKKIPEEIQRLLKTVVDECEREDRAVRERQVRTARRLKLFWEGYQRIWYSEVAHDWRIWDIEQAEGSDQSSYDKVVNVYRAYLESIIAALSVVVPPIKCFPDDADNTLDLETARAGDKISELIYRHNDGPLLWIHGLFVFCTEGMIANYTYSKKSKEYGTWKNKKYDEQEEEREITTCSLCGHELSNEVVPSNVSPLPNQMGGPQLPNQSLPNQQLPQGNIPLPGPQITDDQELNEFDPDNQDAPLHNLLGQGMELCPSCMQMMDPDIKRDKFIVTRLVGVTEEPKSRVHMEAYGLLNVQVPNYARRQCDCPYLIFSYESNYAMAVEEFGDLYNNSELLRQIKSQPSAGGYNLYDQWARLSPQYQGQYPINVVTVKRAWLRPGSFNLLQNEDDVARLKKLFPDGAKVIQINDQFADACNESLDDHWTLTYNPLADFVNFDPLGLLLTSIQEITNDLISLTLQTIEHGIAQTFADPAVLDFTAYSQTEVTPGGIFPATPKSGKSLNDAFHDLKTATLSGEVMPFSQNIQSYGQLVSGALPSLFGGSLQGSETASQYSMSRAQALQRLQNTWKILTSWWKNSFGKAIPLYIKEFKDDERDVKQNADGNFVNVFIRRAELEGKIGKVELEANENLPLTWAQTKDVIMNLLSLNNQEIQTFLQAPENLTILREAIGLNDFYVPGEEDKEKQYDEIKLLLNSEPIPSPDGQETSSIPIDPDYDNHPIEFEICRKWIISPVGRQAKVENEPGYRNVLLHGKMHLQAIQQKAQQPKPPEPPNVSYSFKGEDLADPQVRAVFDKVEQIPFQPELAGVSASPNPKKPSAKNAPIQGENDVETIQ